MSLPRGTIDWSAMCDCDISWLNKLTCFSNQQHVKGSRDDDLRTLLSLYFPQRLVIMAAIYKILVGQANSSSLMFVLCLFSRHLAIDILGHLLFFVQKMDCKDL